ncbi:MAG: multicopper oxidase family protein, partial [Mesorhizobium sp.]
MHRREFLVASLATLASSTALAQTKMDMSNMDSMPGTDMSGHAGHDMGAMAKGAVALPEGEALRNLPLLANEAST